MRKFWTMKLNKKAPDSPKRGVAHESDKQTKDRNRAFQEIVDTEKSYVNSLQTIVDLYMRPLSEASFLKDDDFNIIFGNIETLFTLNQRFLSDLQVHMKYAPSKQMIGGLFMEFAPFFKMYSHYVKNHENGSRLLNTLAGTGGSNKRLINFIEKVSKEPRSKGLTLASFLIMPIQRVPRYKLLIEALIKCTPISYEDYPDLSRAMESLKNVAYHINEEARAQENRNKIREIQDLFSDDPEFISPGRFFVKMGELSKWSRDGKSSKNFTWILFNNLLANASKGVMGGKLKLVSYITIDSAFAVQSLNNENSKNYNTKKVKIEYAMCVSSGNETFILESKSKEETDNWVSSIKSSIEWQKELETIEIKTTSVAGQKGLWVDQNSVTNCTVCDASFTVFRRKHHCRQCGNVVCDACCTKREITNRLGERKIKRICGSCDLLLSQLDGDNEQKKMAEPQVYIKSWSRDDKSKITYYLITIVNGAGKTTSEPIPKRYKEFISFDKLIKKKCPLLKTDKRSKKEKEAAKKATKTTTATTTTTTTTATTATTTTQTLNNSSKASVKITASDSTQGGLSPRFTLADTDGEENKQVTEFLIPKLPKKALSFGKKNVNLDLLEERRGIFQIYLKTIFNLFPVYPDVRKAIAEWLGLDAKFLEPGEAATTGDNCSIM